MLIRNQHINQFQSQKSVVLEEKFKTSKIQIQTEKLSWNWQKITLLCFGILVNSFIFLIHNLILNNVKQIYIVQFFKINLFSCLKILACIHNKFGNCEKMYGLIQAESFSPLITELCEVISQFLNEQKSVDYQHLLELVTHGDIIYIY